MKKHSALSRASGILLVLTLATSCVVGGTFAKYVTEGKGTDSARVAKWGVEVTANNDMFDAYYGKDNPNYTLTKTVDGKQVSVLSSNETETVVAPGTEKQYAGITVTGQPEVAVEVETTATVNLGENWVDDEGKYYCPLVFTVAGKPYSGLDYDNIIAFQNAIEGAIETAGSAICDVNTNLEEHPIDTSFSWKWPFAGENEGGTGHANQTDEKDTQLGNKAANEPDKAPGVVELTVTTTVTQID